MKQNQYFIKEINKKDLFKTFPRKKKTENNRSVLFILSKIPILLSI